MYSQYLRLPRTNEGELLVVIDAGHQAKGNYDKEVVLDLGDAYRLTDPATVSVRAGGK